MDNCLVKCTSETYIQVIESNILTSLGKVIQGYDHRLGDQLPLIKSRLRSVFCNALENNVTYDDISPSDMPAGPGIAFQTILDDELSRVAKKRREYPSIIKKRVETALQQQYTSILEQISSTTEEPEKSKESGPSFDSTTTVAALEDEKSLLEAVRKM